MNKRIVVSAAFVVIVIVVIVSFTSYQVDLMDKQNEAMERFIKSKQKAQMEFENGSPILGS